MADDKKPAGKPADKPASPLADPFVEVVWFIVSALVIIYLINGLVGMFGPKGFSILGFGVSGTTKTISLSEAPTILGDKVQVSGTTAVYAAPGVNQIATKLIGLNATIIEGPITKDGVKYWHVKFEDGLDGWVEEGNLNYLQSNKQPLAEVLNPQGGKVSVMKTSTPVYSDPGANQIGIKRINAEGQIIGGPVTKDGLRYWKIQFDDGLTGWVAENDLNYLDFKSVPLSSVPTIIGGQVVALNNGIALYNSPGGNQIGTETKGNIGKIIEGPLLRNGTKYWYIKFNDGKEGWVAEDDLGYVENSETNIINQTTDWLKNAFSVFKYISIIFSLLMAGFVIYLYRKITELREVEAKALYVEAPKSSDKLKNPHWEKILNNVESENESDWRLAILEADIMLDSLLNNLGLPGDTMADKLKAVDKADFTTIDNAWEGHKIRNQVAHEGATFTLNQREAKRVIGLYQTVFDEFKII